MAKTMTIDGNTAAAHVAYAFQRCCCHLPHHAVLSHGGSGRRVGSTTAARTCSARRSTLPRCSPRPALPAQFTAPWQAGALTTTFTASQGLLLMIPNMYKIAGELLPGVFHVSARALAHPCPVHLRRSQRRYGLPPDRLCHACFRFRTGGYGSGAGGPSVRHQGQRALRALLRRLPHLSRDPEDRGHRLRGYGQAAGLGRRKATSASAPSIPSIPHQPAPPRTPTSTSRTARLPTSYYRRPLPDIVQEYMDKVGELTGRKYNLFDYVGAPDAENVIVIMGCGCRRCRRDHQLPQRQGRSKLGLHQGPPVPSLRCRQVPGGYPRYRARRSPFWTAPRSPAPWASLCIRTSCTALVEAGRDDIKVVGGRYGLGSKEFTPTMVKAVYDNLDGESRRTTSPWASTTT